jgi:hypothetical protein
MKHDDLNAASLAYLAGVKKTINECGMAGPAMSSPPSTPATINITAATGQELSGMLKDIMSLAGAHKVEPHHMPDTPHVGHSKVLSAPPMQSLLDIVDSVEDEEPSEEPQKMVKDSMNHRGPYTNSPKETGKQEGHFPMDGDQDNNIVAAKDKIVSRESVSNEEKLYNDYKKFVSENKKKCCCEEKGKKQCPVHSKKDSGVKIKESLTNTNQPGPIETTLKTLNIMLKKMETEGTKFVRNLTEEEQNALHHLGNTCRELYKIIDELEDTISQNPEEPFPDDWLEKMESTESLRKTNLERLSAASKLFPGSK